MFMEGRDNCSILVTNLVRPCSVLVNVNSRKLLWSEWGANSSDGSIVSSNLDGSTLKMIINNLAKPQDLVFDGTSDVLYWLARPYDVYIIQSINLNTGYRQIYSVESSGHAAPTLSLLTDHLYWTMSNSTLIINKFTGGIEKSLATGSAVRASIYHPVLYRSLTSQANPCDNSSCSHLCVPSNNHYGHRCLCPVDMYLDVEGNCSRKEGGESLLVSSISGIYEVPTYFIGNHGFRSRRIVETEVNCLVYDKVGDRIFYHDDTTREIRTISLKYPRRPRTLYSKVHMVEGMALDTTSGVIYWTVNQGSVHAGSVDGSFSRKLISDLSRPRGITVDPEHGFLYICDWGNDAKILRCHMDGSHCLVYFHAHGGHPNMVAIASPVTIETEEMTKWVNTLYWTDSKQNSISYANLGVDVLSLDTISLNLSLDSHPYGLVVTDRTIYFTDLNSKYVHYVEKSDVTKEIDMQLDVGILFALDHTHRSIHVSDTVCSMNNGGCTHLCLVKPKGQRTCLCPDSVNNISCTVTEEQALFKTNLSNVLDKEKLKKEFVTIETEREDTVLFWAVPLTGFLIILCAVTFFVACYYRNKKRKQNWMCKFIQYMKARHSEDSEGLVSDSTSSMSDPHFRQYDDIDYPDDSYCLRNLRDHNTRETSMISTDSAFTEMRDFDVYSSIDND
ncbi:low-density lipoprotein receptor-related protein 6-like [Ruditapes philippinarum]|uniref:low-density lipoprotein receptor-related protein 6-like n=1 Tax=Ruditapes philippinarum TaxID=129788 RepID=UPI00295AD27F|nr:low-density lipoprotein receptor-related protein 6-like [Ruditapes philippinarum]